MKIKLSEIADVQEVLRIKTELVECGLIQGQDFSFAYHPAHWDDFTGHNESRWLEIDIGNEKKSLGFLMKYYNRIEIIKDIHVCQ
jgi:hypothetical protein